MGNCIDLIRNPTIVENRIYLEGINFSDIFAGQNGYAVDESGNVIGLNLSRKSLKTRDILFLKAFDTLKWLDLSNNMISDISPLASLTALKKLDLSSNRIKDISYLGSLKKLNRLNLEKNRIAVLPDDILTWGMEIRLETQLPTGITLGGNPLTEVLIDTIKKGRQELESYFSPPPQQVDPPTIHFDEKKDNQIPSPHRGDGRFKPYTDTEFQQETGTISPSISSNTHMYPGMKEKTRILVLAANPKDTSRVGFGEEIRKIEDCLEMACDRNNFELKIRLEVRFRDIRRQLVRFKPHIVHFIGHGNEEGIKVGNKQGNAEEISIDVLAELFELCAHYVDCVILNACYSAPQAKAISEHIDYVIGMRAPILDDAAIEFAMAFYETLTAGETVESSFALARLSIKHSHPQFPIYFIPSLHKKK